MDALLVDVDAAAKLLGGINRQTIYRLVRRGELPAVRIGPKMIRFSPEELRKWIAKRNQSKRKG